MFVGRKKELALVRKRIKSFSEGYRQNIAILAPPLTGKTSLLKTAFLDNPEKTVLINVSARNVEFSRFVKHILSSLLYNFLSSRSRISPYKEISSYHIDYLLIQAEKIIPATTEKIKKTLSQEKHSFESISLPLDTFITEASQKIIFAIENFTYMRSFPKKVLSSLAKYIMVQKEIMYILTSSETTKAKDILSSELNLLFGNFEIIDLKNLSPKEGQILVNIQIENIPNLAAKFIAEITGGQPFYLSCLIQALKSYQIKSWDDEFLSEAISQILTSEYSLIYQKFSDRISTIQTLFKNDASIINILTAVAYGYRRIQEISSAVKIPAANIRNKLVKLTEERIISKSGMFYYITDIFFSFWLSNTLRIKREIPLSKEEIKHAVKLLIKEDYYKFKEMHNENELNQIISLIKLFKDDTVSLGRKKIILPQIRKYKVIPSSKTEDLTYIIGEGRQYLILAFKNGVVNENDILEFVNRCSYFKNRQIKKILITPKSIPDVSKLLAKEKRLIIWEEPELKFLMRLYNKYMVI